MKYLVPALLAAIAIISQGAIAADNSSSPYDTNPACRDRNVDSTKGDCVIKDTGTPRHTYPPRTKATPGTPTTPATPAAPREAAPASGRKGG